METVEKVRLVAKSRISIAGGPAATFVEIGGEFEHSAEHAAVLVRDGDAAYVDGEPASETGAGAGDAARAQLLEEFKTAKAEDAIAAVQLLDAEKDAALLQQLFAIETGREQPRKTVLAAFELKGVA